MTTTGAIWRIKVERTKGFPGGKVLLKDCFDAEEGLERSVDLFHSGIMGITEKEYYAADIDYYVTLQYSTGKCAWTKELQIRKDLYNKIRIGDMVHIETGLDGWEDIS